MNFWLIFLTGLTVGGLTCLAVQGGLLASVIASKEDEEIDKGINNRNTVFPTSIFLIARLISHTLVGLLLGAFGGVIGFNQSIQVVMQFVAGVYMIFVALNLLNVHPIFRYAIIQPPKFLTRRVKNASKSKDLFAPALLGAMTIFIPCGTTLAMEALAISVASPISGAFIMAAFVLGTTPLFFGIGWLTSILGDSFRATFLKFAALVVIYLGISAVNGALVASGSNFSLQELSGKFQTDSPKEKIQKVASEGQISNKVHINVTASGYSPQLFKVKKGIPVNITLTSKDAYSCASAFRIPSLGISKNLQPDEVYKISFTPTKSGDIIFTCSMGMYSGVIEVI